MATSVVPQGTTSRLRCLGTVMLTDAEGDARSFRTRKQIGLLLYLARRAGRPVPREELIELLWSSDPEKAARHSLSQTISLINKALKLEAIVTADRDRLTLVEGTVSLDVTDFERLAAAGDYDGAMKLWKGTLLEGVYVQRAPAFERWLSEERGRLERVYRRMAHAKLEALRVAGDYAAMRDESERLLQFDPLDEKAMLAHLESMTLMGERVLALRRYSEFEKRIAEELSAEPDEALRGWAKRNRRSDNQGLRVTAPARISEITVLPTAVPVFGRQDEFADLWKAWGESRTGKGAVLIVEGEPGIGKTALLSKLANQVHVGGGSVCFVTCYGMERAVPLAPITMMVRQLSLLPGFVATEGVWIGELSRLAPELRTRFPSAPPAMAVDDGARHRLSHAAVQCAVAVADEHPVVIVIDDLQHADEATLALLHYLARLISVQEILLVVAVRSEFQQTTALQTFLDSISALPQAKSILVPKLAPTDMERLIRQLLARLGQSDATETIEQVLEKAQGNPLHAIEATVALATLEHKGESEDKQRVPDGFDASALDRLKRLGPQAILVATSASLAGRPLTYYELSTITELPIADLSRALSQLENHRFMHRVGEAFALVHANYARVIEKLCEKTDQLNLHLKIADLLARSAAENPTARFESALHYSAANHNARARNQARQAARHAQTLGATRERAAALDLVLETSDTFVPDDAIELIRCLLELREHGRVLELCECAERNQLTAVEAASIRFARLATAYNNGAESTYMVAEGLRRLLLECKGFKLAPSARMLLMRVATRAADHNLMRKASKELRRSYNRGDAGWATYAHLALAYTAAKYYWPHRALPLLRRAVEEAQTYHDLELEHLCRIGLGAVRRQLGEFQAAIAETELALALARRTLNPGLEAADLSDMAVAEFAMGNYEAAEAHFATSLSILEGSPEPSIETFARVNRAEMLLLSGNIREAIGEFTKARALAETMEQVSNLLQALAGLALCAQSQGDLAGLASWSGELRRIGNGRERLFHDRWMTECALAWEIASLQGEPRVAIEQLEMAARDLSRRDVDHWLLVECERLRIESEYVGMNHESTDRVLAQAARFGAGGVILRLKKLLPKR